MSNTYFESDSEVRAWFEARLTLRSVAKQRVSKGEAGTSP